eukprot:TRINITY_DN9464_c1_g1_i2.p1 TRINITY_DN9464_c1_g1~~TRINITY_DN9464_c1_g1_i2.p1  ORF type:complete len:108 (+),score=11.07 TRINITY_DN9464_c1_g1_i2:278-601(+)
MYDYFISFTFNFIFQSYLALIARVERAFATPNMVAVSRSSNTYSMTPQEREEADTFTAAIRAGPTPPPSRPSSERGGSTIMVLAGPKQNCHRRLHLHHYHYHHLRLH